MEWHEVKKKSFLHDFFPVFGFEYNNKNNNIIIIGPHPLHEGYTFASD